MVVLKNTEAIKEKSDKYDHKNTLNLYMTIKIPWTESKKNIHWVKHLTKAGFLYIWRGLTNLGKICPIQQQ